MLRSFFSLSFFLFSALNALVIATCDEIEESEYRELSHVTVRQLLDIYCKQDDLTGVYTVLELREDLLKLLRTLILVPNSVRLRPIQPAQAVFVKALNWEQDPDLKIFCRESLLVFKLIARPTLPVEILLHSKTVGETVDVRVGETVDVSVGETTDVSVGGAADVSVGETIDVRVGGAIDVGVGETVDVGISDKTERNHFEDRRGTDNGGEMGEELVNGTVAESGVNDVITIMDDSLDMTHDQTRSDVCSASPIAVIDLKEPMKSPSPRKVEDNNQSIFSLPGSSNYVTANDSTLTGSQILSPESDYMEILDELS